MFRFFSNLRRRWKIQSFRKAYIIALESRNNKKRLAAARYALKIVKNINPWLITEVPRKKAIGKLHGSLARTYLNLLHENPPYFSQLAIEESYKSLEFLTREDGIDWSLTMNNLAIIYGDSIIGDREENLEKAIQATELALTAIESEKHPLWFKAMANLGSYYSNRRREDYSNNIKKSIQIFEEILYKLNKDLQPIDAAGIMVNLANTYCKDVGQDHQEKIEKAIDMLEEALSSFSLKEAPGLWGIAQSNLSMIYAERIKGIRNENIEKSMKANTLAMDAFEKIGDRESWANAKLIQANLLIGYSYSNLASNLKEAEVSINDALEVYTSERYPIRHAEALQLISNIKRSRQNKNRRADIEEAIMQGEEALLSSIVQHDRQLLISTLHELGDLYAERIEGDRSTNMERSIELLYNAIELIDQRSYPYRLGMALNSLAQSYHSRIKGLRADNIEMVIALCEQAVFIMPKISYPNEHSHILETLGDGYLNRLRGNKKENVKLAMQIFTTASTNRDKNQNPEGWLRLEKKYLLAERTWTSLDLSKADKKNNFVYDTEKYLSILHENAKTVSPEDDERTWIHAQIFLADAYTQLTPLDLRRNDIEQFFKAFLTNLEKALEIYKSTLPVAKKMGDDFECAIIQSRIGIAHTLGYLILKQLLESKNEDENDIRDNDRVRRYYELGVLAFEKALEISPVAQAPRRRLSAAVGLGQLHADQNNWIAADVSFTLASKALDYVLGNIEINESDATAILNDLGQMASLAPYVCLVLNQPKRAIELSEHVKTRLLAKALTLESLPLSDAIREEVHFKQCKVAALERKLSSPWLFYRKKPLEESIKLRKEIRNLIGVVDLNETLRINQEFITRIVDDHSVIVLPIMAKGEGRLIIIHSSYGRPEIDVFKCPSLEALQKILGPSDTQKLAFTAKSQRDSRGSFDDLVASVGIALGEIFAIPLINALESLGIQQGQHIDIILQGSLGVLPLGLAKIESTGKILLEHYEISLSPSLKVLDHVKIRKSFVPKSLTALANPDGTLIYAETETSIIRNWFAANESWNQYIEGKSVKVEEMLSLLRGKDIWHFATHGEFNSITPKQSSLKLSNTDFLTLERLLESTGIGNPRLVILSACETGLYDLKALPNEFIGLPSGFLQAGAAGVISTLWSVEDKSTALLMGKFYEAYMGENLSPSAALQKAQLWLKTATYDDLIQNLTQWEKGENAPILRGEIKNIKNQLETTIGTRGSGFADRKLNLSKICPYSSPRYWGGFVHYGV